MEIKACNSHECFIKIAYLCHFKMPTSILSHIFFMTIIALSMNHIIIFQLLLFYIVGVIYPFFHSSSRTLYLFSLAEGFTMVSWSKWCTTIINQIAQHLLTNINGKTNGNGQQPIYPQFDIEIHQVIEMVGMKQKKNFQHTHCFSTIFNWASSGNQAQRNRQKTKYAHLFVHFCVSGYTFVN